MAFFNRVFSEIASAYPQIATDHCYIDAIMSTIAGEPPEHTVNRAVLDDERYRERLAAYAAAFTR